MLIIKNGKIIDPIGDAVYPADLYVKDGVIARIVRRRENSSDESCSCGEKKNGRTDVEVESGSEVLDAKGMLIAPGLRIRMCIFGIRDLHIRRIFCRERRPRRRAATRRSC